MTTRPLVLWGAGGQARVLREFCEPLGFRVVAVFDNAPMAVSPFGDVPIHHGWEGFSTWRRSAPGPCEFLAAIGGLRGNPRMAIHERLVGAGLIPATVVHPRAWVATNATIGAGSQILAGALIAAEARIGLQCIINTGASVDHESMLGDGVHVAPGAVLSGEVKVGAGCFIGAGAVIVHRVTIGPGTVVGAGAVVIRDVPAGVTVVGNPARVLPQPG